MDWRLVEGHEDERNNLHTQNLRLPCGCLQVPVDYENHLM